MKSLAIPYHSKNRQVIDPSKLQSDPAALPTPTPTSPSPKTSSSTSFSLRAASFFRHPTRVQSAFSLNSAYSGGAASHDSTANTSAESSPQTSYAVAKAHPYAAMVVAPVPVVSSQDPRDDEGSCPVCLEPLSSSFRLPGEKPHIVPDCGHALHEVSSDDLLKLRPPSKRDLGRSEELGDAFANVNLVFFNRRLVLSPCMALLLDQHAPVGFRENRTWGYVGCAGGL